MAHHCRDTPADDDAVNLVFPLLPAVESKLKANKKQYG